MEVSVEIYAGQKDLVLRHDKDEEAQWEWYFNEEKMDLDEEAIFPKLVLLDLQSCHSGLYELRGNGIPVRRWRVQVKGCSRIRLFRNYDEFPDEKSIKRQIAFGCYEDRLYDAALDVINEQLASADQYVKSGLLKSVPLHPSHWVAADESVTRALLQDLSNQGIERYEHWQQLPSLQRPVLLRTYILASTVDPLPSAAEWILDDKEDVWEMYKLDTNAWTLPEDISSREHELQHMTQFLHLEQQMNGRVELLTATRGTVACTLVRAVPHPTAKLSLPEPEVRFPPVPLEGRALRWYLAPLYARGAPQAKTPKPGDGEWANVPEELLQLRKGLETLQYFMRDDEHPLIPIEDKPLISLDRTLQYCLLAFVEYDEGRGELLEPLAPGSPQDRVSLQKGLRDLENFYLSPPPLWRTGGAHDPTEEVTRVHYAPFRRLAHVFVIVIAPFTERSYPLPVMAPAERMPEPRAETLWRIRRDHRDPTPEARRKDPEKFKWLDLAVENRLRAWQVVNTWIENGWLPDEPHTWQRRLSAEASLRLIDDKTEANILYTKPNGLPLYTYALERLHLLSGDMELDLAWFKRVWISLDGNRAGPPSYEKAASVLLFDDSNSALLQFLFLRPLRWLQEEWEGDWRSWLDREGLSTLPLVEVFGMMHNQQERQRQRFPADYWLHGAYRWYDMVLGTVWPRLETLVNRYDAPLRITAQQVAFLPCHSQEQQHFLDHFFDLLPLPPLSYSRGRKLATGPPSLNGLQAALRPAMEALIARWEHIPEDGSIFSWLAHPVKESLASAMIQASRIAEKPLPLEALLEAQAIDITLTRRENRHVGLLQFFESLKDHSSYHSMRQRIIQLYASLGLEDPGDFPEVDLAQIAEQVQFLSKQLVDLFQTILRDRVSRPDLWFSALEQFGDDLARYPVAGRLDLAYIQAQLAELVAQDNAWQQFEQEELPYLKVKAFLVLRTSLYQPGEQVRKALDPIVADMLNKLALVSKRVADWLRPYDALSAKQREDLKILQKQVNEDWAQLHTLLTSEVLAVNRAFKRFFEDSSIRWKEHIDSLHTNLPAVRDYFAKGEHLEWTEEQIQRATLNALRLVDQIRMRTPDAPLPEYAPVQSLSPPLPLRYIYKPVEARPWNLGDPEIRKERPAVTAVMPDVDPDQEMTPKHALEQFGLRSRYLATDVMDADMGAEATVREFLGSIWASMDNVSQNTALSRLEGDAKWEEWLAELVSNPAYLQEYLLTRLRDQHPTPDFLLRDAHLIAQEFSRIAAMMLSGYDMITKWNRWAHRTGVKYLKEGIAARYEAMILNAVKELLQGGPDGDALYYRLFENIRRPDKLHKVQRSVIWSRMWLSDFAAELTRDWKFTRPAVPTRDWLEEEWNRRLSTYSDRQPSTLVGAIKQLGEQIKQVFFAKLPLLAPPPPGVDFWTPIKPITRLMPPLTTAEDGVNAFLDASSASHEGIARVALSVRAREAAPGMPSVTIDKPKEFGEMLTHAWINEEMAESWERARTESDYAYAPRIESIVSLPDDASARVTADLRTTTLDLQRPSWQWPVRALQAGLDPPGLLLNQDLGIAFQVELLQHLDHKEFFYKYNLPGAAKSHPYAWLIPRVLGLLRQWREIFQHHGNQSANIKLQSGIRVGSVSNVPLTKFVRDQRKTVPGLDARDSLASLILDSPTATLTELDELIRQPIIGLWFRNQDPSVAILWDLIQSVPLAGPDTLGKPITGFRLMWHLELSLKLLISLYRQLYDRQAKLVDYNKVLEYHACGLRFIYQHLITSRTMFDYRDNKYQHFDALSLRDYIRSVPTPIYADAVPSQWRDYGGRALIVSGKGGNDVAFVEDWQGVADDDSIVIREETATTDWLRGSEGLVGRPQSDLQEVVDRPIKIQEKLLDRFEPDLTSFSQSLQRFFNELYKHGWDQAVREMDPIDKNVTLQPMREHQTKDFLLPARAALIGLERSLQNGELTENAAAIQAQTLLDNLLRTYQEETTHFAALSQGLVKLHFSVARQRKEATADLTEAYKTDPSQERE
jgi:hypothetical protein